MPLPDPWFSLADALKAAKKSKNYAALYDTIQRNGISRIDEFGRVRPCGPQSEEAKWAMRYVIHVFDYETYGPPPGRENDPPPAYGEGLPDDLTWQRGWPEPSPTFTETVASETKHVSSTTGSTKQSDSQFLIIASLLRKLKIDWKERGAAGRVRALIEEAGFKMDDGTVLRVLMSISDSVERRDKG